MLNKVFIATSIDGYIADKNNRIEWLDDIPTQEGEDMGYNVFMADIDALIMGRKTYETVLGFNIPWPYEKPVFILSNSLTGVPHDLEGKVHIISGDLKEILSKLNRNGFRNLYVDGGQTIQSFLREGLIDEMIITTIPIILGGGIPLFGDLPEPIKFECTETKCFFGQIVQNKFIKQ